MARLKFMAVAVLLLSIMQWECAGQPRPPSHTSATATSSPHPVSSATMQSTGVPVLDEAMVALAQGNAAAIDRLLVFAARSCSTAGGPGSVECPEGAGNGTPVQVFAFATCTTHWIPQTLLAESRQSVFANLFVDGGYRTVAVAMPNPGNADPTAAFYIIADQGGPSRRALLVAVNETGITSISSGCGASSADLVHQFSEFLLPPPGP